MLYVIFQLFQLFPTLSSPIGENKTWMNSFRKTIFCESSKLDDHERIEYVNLTNFGKFRRIFDEFGRLNSTKVLVFWTKERSTKISREWLKNFFKFLMPESSYYLWQFLVSIFVKYSLKNMPGSLYSNFQRNIKNVSDGKGHATKTKEKKKIY